MKIKFLVQYPQLSLHLKNGDLDLVALERFVDFQLKGGVDGIVVAGSTVKQLL